MAEQNTYRTQGRTKSMKGYRVKSELAHIHQAARATLVCQQPEVGAQCGSSARWDLRGGRLVKGRPYRNCGLSSDVLMGKLASRIADKKVLRLIRRYLQAGVMSGGVVVERYKGTPQGGPLSPLLANVLLDGVDKELERRGHAFVRYADDCNIYVQSQRAGDRVMALMRRLFAKLRLQINEAKSAVAPIEERKFLGFTLWRNRKGVVKIWVASKSLKVLKNQVRERTKRSCGRSIPQVIEGLRKYLLGWRAYYGLSETPWVLERISGWIRRRLRALQLHHWRHGRTIYRELVARGIRPRQARQVASGANHCWKNSKRAIHYALPNRLYEELGLPSLVA